MENREYLKTGTFFAGCNYWASHAGTAMWRDWRPETVDDDLVRLQKLGIRILRAFPLWPDFQPITLMRSAMGEPVEFSFNEQFLPDTEEGRAGVDPVMLERFGQFLDMAHRRGMRVIVGLLTGWMSGRLHVPPAIDGKNVLTDPLSMMLEVRFVTCFVRRFKGHPAVEAWDLGNECNCMAPVDSREQAWLWTASVANAIRAADPAGKIVSGMHGLSLKDAWRIEDQAELCDILTVHPYPLFTPHCALDPLDTMRTVMHGAAECTLYADIGKKPCLVEETGSLSSTMGDEETAARFARACMFSAWAHDGLGYMWWCANDQMHLDHAPYDWCDVERELGLLRQDKTAKPVALEMARFTEFLQSLPFEKLPERRRDAVCILTEGQDQWGVAFISFLLAKQAGFDIAFQSAHQPLRDAALYLLPSVKGTSTLRKRILTPLLEKIKQGAVLYVSYDGGMISPLETMCGIRSKGRSCSGSRLLRLDGVEKDLTLAADGNYHLNIDPLDAKVLGCGQDGGPALTCSKMGLGKVYFLNAAPERMLADKPGHFTDDNNAPYWKIYAQIIAGIPSARLVGGALPSVGLTEHALGGGKHVIIAINYNPAPYEGTLILRAGRLKSVLYGEARQETAGLAVRIPGNDAAVFILTDEARQNL